MRPLTEHRREVRINADGVILAGDLTVPATAGGVVIFAHGSGSSRHSSRNKQVATYLNEHGLATLLMDLLTLDEEAIDVRTRHLRFDIGMLADRVHAAEMWVRDDGELGGLAIGLFGASTGAAAALAAAAHPSSRVGAVVSRGGRPDLAGDALRAVRAPTLLIVGALDDVVIELNKEAYEQLQVRKELVIVPGATHLFEEPGALERVSELAEEWFRSLG